ncbi:DNA/RNA non-specific endonuclease [Crystallibacter degradans]|uniref:DNA/RNA non-specific endonuclease n=1 Tax=Crystallibacter degradans TaxID=2726743 RepID=UPI001473106D|nr:DNA/RNA non-specific endonuclease [Arthrobacter sp. SF27]NMR31378.1 DNA/RNA non-specific endonuclease [Arthrobacter sp. SF27]
MTQGYSADFLLTTVELPRPATAVKVLDYTHFTICLNTQQRLAELAAVNIDGAQLQDLPREDNWRLDPRLAADLQAGEDLYRGNDLDRGHLVRRLDPVWGRRVEAAKANTETFFYTNAAPQVNTFNQSKDLWLGLEDYLMDHADNYDTRLSVFTGPVFDDADPRYRGFSIPLLFWKVAAWRAAEGIASTAYILDQSPLLDEIELERLTTAATAAGEIPPLGPYRTFQVPVQDVQSLTGLGLEQLVEADRFTARGHERDGQPRWLLLERPEQMRLKPGAG